MSFRGCKTYSSGRAEPAEPVAVGVAGAAELATGVAALVEEATGVASATAEEAATELAAAEVAAADEATGAALEAGVELLEPEPEPPPILKSMQDS